MKTISSKIISIFAANAMLVAIAQADVVVIGNLAAPAMTKDEVTQFFLGKSQTMKPLDRPNSEPIKAQFYQKLSGQDLSQVKATWARLVFTGKASSPKELPDAAAVKKAVAADPKAIGYIDKSEVDSTVKVLLSLN
jgi:ABC-type phosphate transport system substrate-binding protein